MQGPFVVGSHHLARELSSLQHKVLHLSTPVSPLHYFKDDICRTRFALSKNGAVSISPDLWEYIPRSLIPAGRLSILGNDTSLHLTMPQLPRVLADTHFDSPDILLIDQPSLVGLFNFIKPEVAIYRPTDIYPEMTGLNRTITQEKSVLKRVDAIVATSSPVLKHVNSLCSRQLPSMIIENGVELKRFSTPAEEPLDIRSISRPRIIYTGALDERFDWDAIIEAAKLRDSYNFILIGPARTVPAGLDNYKNIHALGARPYTALPGYLQACDMAILPMINTLANEGRSPMKLYEYLAAGLGVVASATEELERRSNARISLYYNSAGFTECLDNYENYDAPPDLSEYDWKKKADSILEFASNVKLARSRHA